MEHKPFGELAKQALTSVQASQGQSTRQSPDAKRMFLQTFRRWERLFRRRDGDVEADRWLLAEYFRALGHLPPDKLDTLTDMLIRQHTFFPSIAECLKLMECGRYDYGHPFHSVTHAVDDADPEQIGASAWRQTAIADYREAKALEDKRAQALLTHQSPADHSTGPQSDS